MLGPSLVVDDNERRGYTRERVAIGNEMLAVISALKRAVGYLGALVIKASAEVDGELIGGGLAEGPYEAANFGGE